MLIITISYKGKMKFDAELKFEDAVIQERIGVFLETDIHLISGEDERNNHVHSKWKFRCNVCRCIVTGIYGAQNHMESQRHKQNVIFSKTGEGSFIESKDKAKSENESNEKWSIEKNENNMTCLGDSGEKIGTIDMTKTSTTDDNIMVVPLPGKTQVPKAAYPYLTMQEKLKSLVEPIVGLESVIEHHIGTGEMPPYYECQLCKSDMADANLINHLKGRCHRMNYIQTKNIEKYGSISSLASYNVGKAMLDTIKDMEQEYGRGFMPIIIDKDVSRHPDSKNYQLLRERMKENEKAVSQKRAFGPLENTSNNKERKKKRGIIGKIENKVHLPSNKALVANSGLSQHPTASNATYNNWPFNNFNNANMNMNYSYPNMQGWTQEQVYYYQNQYYQSYVTPPPINPELCPVTVNQGNPGQTSLAISGQVPAENKIIQQNSDNLPLLGTAPTASFNNQLSMMNLNHSMGPMNNNMMGPMNNYNMNPMNNNMTNFIGPGPLNNSNVNNSMMGFINNNMSSMNNNMMGSVNNNMMGSMNNNNMMGSMDNMGLTHNYLMNNNYMNNTGCVSSNMMGSMGNMGPINNNVMCTANDIGSVNKNVVSPMNNSGPVNNNIMGSIPYVGSVNNTDVMRSTNNTNMEPMNQSMMSNIHSNNAESMNLKSVGPLTQGSSTPFPMVQNVNNSTNSNISIIHASSTSLNNNPVTEQQNMELSNSVMRSETTKFDFKTGAIDSKLVQGLLNDNLNAQIKEVINTLKQPSLIQTLVSPDKSQIEKKNCFSNQDTIVSYTTQSSIDQSPVKTFKKQRSSPLVNELNAKKTLAVLEPSLVQTNSNQSSTPTVNYLTVTSTTTDTSKDLVNNDYSESLLEQAPVLISQSESPLVKANKESLSETPGSCPSTQYNFRCIEETIPLLGSDGQIDLSKSITVLTEIDNKVKQSDPVIENGRCHEQSKGDKPELSLLEISEDISKPEGSVTLPTKESPNESESTATADEISNQRGILLEALGSWEIKTEEEASAAVKVITRLTQSLKQYKLKSVQAGVKNVSSLGVLTTSKDIENIFDLNP